MMNRELVRLLLKVNPSSKLDGCWDWGAAKNQHGYGKVADGNGGWVLAHRAAWEAVHGNVPDGMEVCHECDNPACINPDHLFLGSHAENMEDCKQKGRAKGNPGEVNGRAKLTEQDVISIRASKLTSAALARKYGVSHALIRMVRNRTAWKHVPEKNEIAESVGAGA